MTKKTQIVDELNKLFCVIAADVKAVVAAPTVFLGVAKPPCMSGVYLLSVGDEVKYIGEAKGRKGLRDRLLSKHLSGDDNHAIQRAYLIDFPDRELRRIHIKSTVLARWHEIADPDRVAAVERILICLYSPAWNQK